MSEATIGNNHGKKSITVCLTTPFGAKNPDGLVAALEVILDLGEDIKRVLLLFDPRYASAAQAAVAYDKMKGKYQKRKVDFYKYPGIAPETAHYWQLALRHVMTEYDTDLVLFVPGDADEPDDKAGETLEAMKPQLQEMIDAALGGARLVIGNFNSSEGSFKGRFDTEVIEPVFKVLFPDLWLGIEELELKKYRSEFHLVTRELYCAIVRDDVTEPASPDPVPYYILAALKQEPPFEIAVVNLGSFEDDKSERDLAGSLHQTCRFVTRAISAATLAYHRKCHRKCQSMGNSADEEKQKAEEYGLLRERIKTAVEIMMGAISPKEPNEILGNHTSIQ